VLRPRTDQLPGRVLLDGMTDFNRRVNATVTQAYMNPTFFRVPGPRLRRFQETQLIS
jgi:hypothetical protein